MENTDQKGNKGLDTQLTENITETEDSTLHVAFQIQQILKQLKHILVGITM